MTSSIDKGWLHDVIIKYVSFPQMCVLLFHKDSDCWLAVTCNSCNLFRCQESHAL